jgi:aminoglycoside phosphotransferase (APT) family kinase protein
MKDRSAGTMCRMPTAAGVRIRWTDVPAHVRSEVDAILGSPVVEAVSQTGGFSPGTADRVRTADGRRAFVKAVSPRQNERSVTLHRQEAAVSARLPSDPHIPRLLGTYDDGEWIALVLEDVEGAHPVTPWQPAELAATLGMLSELAGRLTPTPIPDLPSASDVLAHDLAGWSRVRADPPEDLDPWARANLDRLAGLAERAPYALSGGTLVHTDVRADNLLVRPDGQVVLVDWPWACRGPAWLDRVLLLVNVQLYGGHDVEALLGEHVGTAVDADDVDALLAGLTGYFVDAARHPAPVGLPTVRAFQRDQGRSTLAWLRRRLSRPRGPGSPGGRSCSGSRRSAPPGR